MAAHQQRVVGVAEDRDVGDRERADGLAVITVAQADELALVRAAAVAPAVEALLERDLDRRGAVAAEEEMAQRAAGARRQTLGQAHGRLVRAAGQHHVRQRIELLLDRVVEGPVGVAEQVDPPRAVGVEIAAALVVDQPGALAAGDRQGRHVLRARHLRARVPDRREAAALPVLSYCFRHSELSSWETAARRSSGAIATRPSGQP